MSPFISNSKFYRKIWKSNILHSTTKFLTCRYPCVHASIQRLKSWNLGKLSFLTGQFIFSFDSINRNFLKNLFFKVITDKAFWFNINKLLHQSVFSSTRTGFYFTNDIMGQKLICIIHFINIFILKLRLDYLNKRYFNIFIV